MTSHPMLLLKNILKTRFWGTFQNEIYLFTKQQGSAAIAGLKSIISVYYSVLNY